jgi:hypothetical protein
MSYRFFDKYVLIYQNDKMKANIIQNKKACCYQQACYLLLFLLLEYLVVTLKRKRIQKNNAFKLV